MCGEGTGCVGVAGTVPAAGSEGACTCWEVASGDGGGREALRHAPGGFTHSNERAWLRASPPPEASAWAGSEPRRQASA